MVDTSVGPQPTGDAGRVDEIRKRHEMVAAACKETGGVDAGRKYFASAHRDRATLLKAYDAVVVELNDMQVECARHISEKVIAKHERDEAEAALSAATIPEAQ